MRAYSPGAQISSLCLFWILQKVESLKVWGKIMKMVQKILIFLKNIQQSTLPPSNAAVYEGQKLDSPGLGHVFKINAFPMREGGDMK